MGCPANAGVIELLVLEYLRADAGYPAPADRDAVDPAGR
jgi:hypothetical protein